MRKERFFPGEVIQIQSAPLDTVLIQLGGVSFASRLSSEGRETVYTVFPNGFIGLEALLSGRAWCTYEALTKVEALILPLKEFENLLKEQPRIFSNMQRFVRTTFSEYTMRRLRDEERLLGFLWNRARRYGTKLSIHDAELLMAGPVDIELLEKCSLTIDEEGFLVEKSTYAQENGGGEESVDGDI
ncbi:MAG: hypothetical protein DRP27_03255 [Thermotogae bacterium]|nr:MAG: hypothetical protein DRP27_03255 [Thermotogota bacterium]